MIWNITSIPKNNENWITHMLTGSNLAANHVKVFSKAKVVIGYFSFNCIRLYL